MHLSLHTLVTCTAIAAASTAALTDLRQGLIPNRLTLPLLAAAPLVHLLRGGPAALGTSLLGALLCGMVPLLLFVRGGLGGGDLKLFVALGALLGFELGLQIELTSLFLLTFYACARLAWQGALLRTLRRAFGLLIAPWRDLRDDASLAGREPLTMVRLGAAIALATVLVLLLPDYLPWLGV